MRFWVWGWKMGRRPGRAVDGVETVHVSGLMPRRRQREAPPSALPGISPARGEIEGGDVSAISFSVASKSEAATGLISPLAGEMAGKPEGGASR